jgi:L-aminopeptidase/D-esterase-like protein
VCLTGGSAYGLAAADGVMEELESRRLGVPVGPEPGHVVPVVPTAVIFDLGRGGAFTNRPTHDFGQRALRAARRRFALGAVGAGTGARAGGLQGGVGSASQQVELGDGSATVAALAVVNASGSPIDLATGSPWTPHPALRRPIAGERRTLVAAIEAIRAAAQPLNTTIGVIVTDAELTRPEAGRLAQAAHDGLGRSIRPAHGLTDGDTIFGLATGAIPLAQGRDGLLRTATSRVVDINALCAAAADVFATACTDAIVHARAIGDALAYTDLCPSALRP